MTSNLSHSERPGADSEDSIQNETELTKEYFTMETKSCDARIDSSTQKIETNSGKVSTSEYIYSHQSTMPKLVDQIPHQLASSIEDKFYNPNNLARYMKNNATKDFVRSQCDNYSNIYRVSNDSEKDLQDDQNGKIDNVKQNDSGYSISISEEGALVFQPHDLQTSCLKTDHTDLRVITGHRHPLTSRPQPEHRSVPHTGAVQDTLTGPPASVQTGQPTRDTAHHQGPVICPGHAAWGVICHPGHSAGWLVLTRVPHPDTHVHVLAARGQHVL